MVEGKLGWRGAVPQNTRPLLVPHVPREGFRQPWNDRMPRPKNLGHAALDGEVIYFPHLPIGKQKILHRRAK